MFNDLSAWFSSSVDDQCKHLWRDNGGSEADFETAMFIFSSDNACPDTERVFHSRAYESDHLAVFHSQYINDMVRAGNRSRVILGQYFLPPQDIVDLVRKQMRFSWDVPSSAGLPQEQGNRQTNASQPHQPGPVASRQPPRNPPQRQASAPPTRQQNSQPAERSSGQPTQRSPERASPRQQGVRSAEGRSPRSQSSRTARESSARPDQQSQEISAVRESQPPGDDVSSSSSLRQLNQQRRAMHTPQRPSSKESTCAQHASAHKRAVEVPAPAHSAKRRKDPSPPHPSPRKTASSRTTRQQTGIPRRRDSSPRRRDSSPRRRDGSPGRRDSSPKRSDGSPRRRDSSPRRRNGSPRRGDRTEATTETSGTSFVVVADVHVGTTDRQNNHRGQGDGQRRQCPVESGRQTGSTDTEVYHISRLTKVVASQVTDFIPGEAGAQVSRKTSARLQH